jgi:hypothetical protein
MNYVTMTLTEYGFEQVRSCLYLSDDLGCSISTELEPEKRKIYVYTRDFDKVRYVERLLSPYVIETTW